MTQAGGDPAWNPLTRSRVTRALNELLYAAQDVLTRYADEDGMYVAPSEVADGGDVIGLIAAGRVQVLDRLQRQIDATRAAFDQAQADIDAYRRRVIGPGYRPLRRN